jgi:tRNA modification GTPase
MREGDTKTPLPRIALVGPPNAGKSTLFNLLTKSESRAIVSEIPGTTRDWLQGEGVLPGGLCVNWIDTAGLTEVPLGELDAKAQEATRDLFLRCDLVVFCHPVSAAQQTDVLRELPTEIPILLVGTLADQLPVQTDLSFLDSQSPQWGQLAGFVSSKTGEGIKALLTRIEDQLAADSESRIPPLGRCQTHLEQADGAIARAHRHALEEDPVELLVLEIRTALDLLGEMTGAVYTNDLLDRVFTRFCIGK